MKTDKSNQTKTPPNSTDGDRSVDRLVGPFNEVMGSDYTEEDLKWELHNGDRNATAFVQGWEACESACHVAWSTIETAPKTGAVILLYMRGEVTAGKWGNPESPSHPWFVLDDGVESGTNGWREGTYGPTHWMPLPSMPNADITDTGHE